MARGGGAAGGPPPDTPLDGLQWRRAPVWAPKSAGPDGISAMGTNLWLDVLTIRLAPIAPRRSRC